MGTSTRLSKTLAASCVLSVPLLVVWLVVFHNPGIVEIAYLVAASIVLVLGTITLYRFFRKSVAVMPTLLDAVSRASIHAESRESGHVLVNFVDIVSESLNWPSRLINRTRCIVYASFHNPQQFTSVVRSYVYFTHIKKIIGSGERYFWFSLLLLLLFFVAWHDISSTSSNANHAVIVCLLMAACARLVLYTISAGGLHSFVRTSATNSIVEVVLVTAGVVAFFTTFFAFAWPVSNVEDGLANKCFDSLVYLFNPTNIVAIAQQFDVLTENQIVCSACGILVIISVIKNVARISELSRSSEDVAGIVVAMMIVARKDEAARWSKKLELNNYQSILARSCVLCLSGRHQEAIKIMTLGSLTWGRSVRVCEGDDEAAAICTLLATLRAIDGTRSDQTPLIAIMLNKRRHEEDILRLVIASQDYIAYNDVENMIRIYSLEHHTQLPAVRMMMRFYQRDIEGAFSVVHTFMSVPVQLRVVCQIYATVYACFHHARSCSSINHDGCGMPQYQELLDVINNVQSHVPEDASEIRMLIAMLLGQLSGIDQLKKYTNLPETMKSAAIGVASGADVDLSFMLKVLD